MQSILSTGLPHSVSVQGVVRVYGFHFRGDWRWIFSLERGWACVFFALNGLHMVFFWWRN
ncbi:conserved protein of unknown function [Pseudomonas marincola]|uniref:Uncharacterized protein n=1 Tax=Pseudomonas marincola TaxID=437900 RepID=A0A653E3Y4_9PSED|nr:conserved protein of unknown function [Pseudomonas marincola]